MKRIHIISLISAVLLITLGGMLILISSKSEDINTTTIAQKQEVIQNEQQEVVQNDAYLSPEKQIQLNEIKSIYSSQETAHRDTVANIMRKYNSNFSFQDQETLLQIIENSNSKEEFTKAAKQQLNLSFLQSDVRAMLQSEKSLNEEKELELTRLELFQEKNLQDLNNNTQKLFKLSLTNILKKNASLESKAIDEIVEKITVNLFGPANRILEFNTRKEQEELISDTLELALASLPKNEIQKIILLFLRDISELEILLDSSSAVINKPTSALWSTPIFESFQKLDFFTIPRTHANDDESSLSQEERDILILKTQVLIEKKLGESIDNEIRYNKNEITKSVYETNIENNLIRLEELVIFKNGLENEGEAISLDNIQRFNLGGYVDDSTAIQDLPVLSYIQEKTGPIIIYNLNGSTKLGEENMSLYSGYGIETLGNSRVTLIFSDESILRLEPFSRVNIFNPSSSNINVEVEQGSIWTRVLKPLLSGDVFTINSDGVGLGVRGTSLSLIKDPDNNTTKINIIDSYTLDGSPSVTLTDNSSIERPIDAGKEILVDSSGNTEVNEISKVQLFTQEPQITNFLRKDLIYMSLLLNDRNRGFYNTPFDSKNDSDNFIKKITGELEVSIPNLPEKTYIIQNVELAGETTNSGSIYHLIKKDELITAIKNNPLGNTASKVQAVRNLDMLSLQDELGNMREIETRFNYNITQDIVSQNDFTSLQLKNIFLNFPIADAQEDSRLLQEVKQNLSINNGSNIVTDDIILPLSLSGVSISWGSTLPDVITQSGEVTIQDINTSVILTATLKRGNLSTTRDYDLDVVMRELSEADELQIALDILSFYISDTIYNKFIDDMFPNAALPNFSQDGGIVPIITWSGSPYINTDGSTNRPTFLESIDNKYKSTNVTVTLEHPLNSDVLLSKQYVNIGIKREDEIDIEVRIPEADVLPEEEEAFDIIVADTQFPTCDVPDVQLSNGQVWAMCNAGSTTSGTGINSYGGIYLYKGGAATAACDIDGYKLPSKSDWEGAISNLESIDNVATTLKLPKAGGVWRKYLIGGTTTIENEKRYWSSTEGNDDEYFTLTDDNLEQQPRRSKFSVRCIRETVIAPVIPPAPNYLQEAKDTLLADFGSGKDIENTRNKVTDITLSSNVSISWKDGNGYIDNSGNVVSRPSFNDTDEYMTLRAELGLIGTDQTLIVEGLNINLLRADCSGTDKKLIDGDCYNLVANAEYNTNYKLGSLTPINTSNLPPLVTESGQKGIKPLLSEGHSLSYNLSELEEELGEDWAIEMSVKGGDLGRDYRYSNGNFINHGLLSISGEIYLFNKGGNIGKNDSSGEIMFTKNTGIGYKSIILTKNKLYFDEENINTSNVLLNNNLVIGSNKNNNQQWNAIINFVKIYKKN